MKETIPISTEKKCGRNCYPDFATLNASFGIKVSIKFA